MQRIGARLIGFVGDEPTLQLSETVFNGDFRFDSADFLTRNLPGYSDSDSPKVVPREPGSSDKAAELSSAKRSFTHRPVYFPPDTTAIQFDFKVSNASDGDFVRIRASGTSEGEWLSKPLSLFTPGWSSLYTVLIGREALKGKWAELAFSIESSVPANAVQSTVLIDNLVILTGAGFIREMSVSPQGQFQFTVVGEPNRTYIIQQSNDLRIWTTMESRVSANGVIQVTSPIGANTSQRFYRVVLQ